MKQDIGKGVASVFGILFAAIGAINVFWGNDPFFGLFVILLSMVFFPFFAGLSKPWLPVRFLLPLRVLLGIFILWSSIGVGELFQKIRMMMESFK